MRLSRTEYEILQSRIDAGRKGRAPAPPKAGCDVESKLHEQIRQACVARGWLAFHGSMSHRTHRTEGEPDFILCLPGRVLFIECKTRTGKLSHEQAATQAWLRKLGHEMHVVRSIEEFWEVVKL